MTLRIILWVFAFFLPALSFGIVLPHAVFMLIPALAAVDGLSGRGSMRRVVVWIGLVLFYEMVYQFPLGVFAVPVVLMSTVHVSIARLIRLEVRGTSERSRPVFLVRTLMVAGIWMFGMLIVSTFIGGSSWHALSTVWWHQGVTVPASFLTALTVLLLSNMHISRPKADILGHGILQTEQNISR